MKNKKEETCIVENVVYKGKIITVNNDEVLCSNGAKSRREIVHHHGGACILAEVDNKIVFVEQYRYAYKENVLELPAGKIEEGDTPLERAKKELEEETGLIAEELIDFGVIYPSVGYTDEKIYLFVALNVTKGKQHLDKDEVLDLIYLSREEIEKYLENNTIKDAKTICLLYKYFQWKKKRS